MEEVLLPVLVLVTLLVLLMSCAILAARLPVSVSGVVLREELVGVAEVGGRESGCGCSCCCCCCRCFLRRWNILTGEGGQTSGGEGRRVVERETSGGEDTAWTVDVPEMMTARKGS